jgi:AAA family ATP:ADP antiporter
MPPIVYLHAWWSKQKSERRLKRRRGAGGAGPKRMNVHSTVRCRRLCEAIVTAYRVRATQDLVSGRHAIDIQIVDKGQLAETSLPSSQLVSTQAGMLDRALAIFSAVRAGEGIGALLLAANVFLLLGAYYILKTVREPLILGQPGGAEVKSYAAAGQAVLFLLTVPIYGAIASRFNRLRLITIVTGFFISNIALFFLLGQAGINIGVAFYLWVGIFNMLVVAQFWAFANDVYTEEQGKRLFPIVGVGASLGAWIGSLATKWLFGVMGPYQLMALAGLILVVCIVLTWAVNVREAGRASTRQAKIASEPLDRSGAFQLIMKDRYLFLIAMLVLLLNFVNTNGEYMVSRFVTESAQALPKEEQGKFIGQFYGDYFSWVNLLGFLIQSLLVSRLFKWIGVGGALFILPCIALGGYSLLALAPVLAIVRGAKILENSTDYSLNNTVRHALFLPTSREAKYKAKNATDTLFVRSGDVLSAAAVFAGTQWLAFTVGGFATFNVALVCVWLGVAVLIRREHAKLTAVTDNK